MDELVKAVSEKTGLPEAQAKMAANAVMEFLQERLPDPIGGQLESLLENPDSLDNAMGLLNMGKSLFGKKK